MHRRVLIGLLFLALPACGDDGGGSGESGSGSTSDASSTTEDPTTTPTTDSTSSSTTDPGSSTTDESTTTDAADSSSSGSESSSSSGGGEFTVTSPAFAEGELFPVSMHSQGGNVSPQLDWTGVPAGTASIGVFFRDLDYMPMGEPFQHSGIWNIPSDVAQLPEGLSMSPMPREVPGAVQCRNWFGEFGYGGPGSLANHYEFTVYALDVADLGAEIDENSSLTAVEDALMAHAIGTATLSGQTQAP